MGVNVTITCTKELFNSAEELKYLRTFLTILIVMLLHLTLTVSFRSIAVKVCRVLRTGIDGVVGYVWTGPVIN